MQYRKRTDKRRFILLLIPLFVIAALLLVINSAINRHYDSVAKNCGKKLCAKVIESCVSKTIEEYQNERLIEIAYNDSGKITSIETDTSAINAIQSKIVDNINSELAKASCTNEKIPLGTLTGNALLIGKGPEIGFDFTYNDSAKVRLVSEFSSAGINQTIHQIYAHITIEVFCISLFRNISFSYEFDYLVCETIIVGEVPERFLTMG